MDIMQGPPEGLSSPPLMVARLASLDTRHLIRKTITEHPEMTPDEVTQLLNKEGIPVSGGWVARITQIIEGETKK